MQIKISVRKFPDGKYLVWDSVPGNKSKQAEKADEVGSIILNYETMYPQGTFDIEYFNGLKIAPLDKDIARTLKGHKAFNI